MIYVPPLQYYRILNLTMYLSLPISFVLFYVFHCDITSFYFNLNNTFYNFLLDRSSSDELCELLFFGNVFTSPFLKENFAKYSILCWQCFFSFSTLNVSSLSLLLCKISEKSDSFMGVPLYVMSYSLAAFKILCLNFNILIIMCLRAIFGLILFGAL